MDPLSLMLGVSGLALQLYGGASAYGTQRHLSESQQEVARLQGQEEAQRRQYMEMDFRRRSVENLRKTQQMAALSQATSTNQGAQFGSGAAAGQGNVRSEGAWNAQGLSGSVEIGRNIFDLNAQISQQRILQAQYGSALATDQGLSSLGGSLLSSIRPARELSGLTSLVQPGGGGGGSQPTSSATGYGFF